MSKLLCLKYFLSLSRSVKFLFSILYQHNIKLSPPQELFSLSLVINDNLCIDNN